MGCSIGRKYLKPEDKNLYINRQEDIRIDPSLFIQENFTSFHTVYRLGQIIGTGSYGEVRLCYRRDNGAKRAVKIFRKDLMNNRSIRDGFFQEIEVLKSLDHPHIIRIYEFFDERTRMYMVMEYCQGGELLTEIIKRMNFTEAGAVEIMSQLLSAVSYLHSKQIIHRDLKPENILLLDKADSLDIKVIDFGTAIRIKDQTMFGRIGTPNYIAPEVLSSAYTELCDLWSCGVIMYVLLAGYPPFDGNTDHEIIQNIKTGVLDLESEPWPDISTEGVDLVRNLICGADVRLPASLALEHPWICSQKNQPPSPTTMKSVLSNLRSFNSSSKLREAVETFIISQCISTQELKTLKDIFSNMDKNRDGKLSREELVDAYRGVYESEECEEEVNFIMKSVDTDNSGFIDYTEFIKASLDQRKILSSDNLKAAFRMFDRDGNGTISAEELRKILQGSARSNDDVWKGIIEEIDQNGDGEIDMHEFEDVLLSSLNTIKK